MTGRRGAALDLAGQCRAAGLPVPERELVFAAPRQFRFDYAWPDRMLAAELDGATWTGGRHTRGAGVETDCDKVNLAIELGWRVLRFTTAMQNDGRALNTLTRVLALPVPR